MRRQEGRLLNTRHHKECIDISLMDHIMKIVVKTISNPALFTDEATAGSDASP
ncbi:MAG: hypothetical protein A4E48_01034 [Methanosaeta sp. PtaU1.Bin060]|nr:MAG: hypothetical protein A4E48_01034 [Methanosaeta sp. PtaU1.Bin060]